MGIIDTIRKQYAFYQVNKYTRRRNSQTDFESKSKDYYKAYYKDGVYLNIETGYDNNIPSTMMASRRSSSSSNTSRHSISLFMSTVLRRNGSNSSCCQPHKRKYSAAPEYNKTSESYTFDGQY